MSLRFTTWDYVTFALSLVAMSLSSLNNWPQRLPATTSWNASSRFIRYGTWTLIHSHFFKSKTHELSLSQIRGVASKQLVNDAVVSVSGRPLSYEQVLCRLPRLEIHELSDDFDLKDNTDHTQLLVKISLEYSQNGGRSAPLDLLLYDSLCWDCSIDGCQANTKENKCFFATGTSALQIFRIGRTIATRVSPGKQQDF